MAGWNSGRTCTDGVAEGIWDAQPPANDGSLRVAVVGDSSASGIEVHASDAVVYDEGYGAKDVTLWYYGTYKEVVGYKTSLEHAVRDELSGKVVGRISYEILRPHKKPSVWFTGHDGADWSTYNTPRQFNIAWNLNGDTHPHAYIFYTGNSSDITQDTVKIEMIGANR